jgi:hypothetical protein
VLLIYQDDEQQLSKIKNTIKGFVQIGTRQIFRALLPAMIPFLPFILLFLLLALFTAGTYGAMTAGSFMTDVHASPEDKAIIARYKDLSSIDWAGRPAWNVNDTYVVGRESYGGNPFYPATPGENIHQLVDKDRFDYENRLKWGTIHAVCLYWAYVNGASKIPDDLPEKVAKDLHPHFYYIKLTDTYSYSCKDGDSGTYEEENYHLVEAHCINGHFQFHYEPVKTVRRTKDCTYTSIVWTRTGTKQLWPDRFQWLKEYLKDFYGIEKTEGIDEEMEIVRNYVLEAGKGFYNQKEWMEWIINKYGISTVFSGAMIPPEYRIFLEEAEERFGIPSWFLAAIIQKESTWNPLSINEKTGCFGLTQQHPDYWKARWVALGFEPPEEYQWDPKAQIFAGAYVLSNFIGDVSSIDWENGGWKSDKSLYKGLAGYGGYGTDVTKAIRQKYITDIIAYAEGMRTPAGWPLPGIPASAVSSWYGARNIGGGAEFHHGIDIACPSGTTVCSVSNGIVDKIGWSGAYGYHIRIKDANHEYLYAHLEGESALIARGDTVKAGQPIALSDNTGRSTGPHLHFGVKQLDADHWIDPAPILGLSH